jgi:hypothetical protein
LRFFLGIAVVLLALAFWPYEEHSRVSRLGTLNVAEVSQ